MTREHINELLTQRPFVPFEMKMSNGDVLQMRHPENALLLRSILYVGFPEEDRAVRCTLHQINTVKELTSQG